MTDEPHHLVPLDLAGLVAQFVPVPPLRNLPPPRDPILGPPMPRLRLPCGATVEQHPVWGPYETTLIAFDDDDAEGPIYVDARDLGPLIAWLTERHRAITGGAQ